MKYFKLSETSQNFTKGEHVVSFWASLSRIHPSNHQAPPNLRKTEIVISLQQVIIRKLSIYGTKL